MYSVTPILIFTVVAFATAADTINAISSLTVYAHPPGIVNVYVPVLPSSAYVAAVAFTMLYVTADTVPS